MKIFVNAHKCEIDKTPVNELELNVTKCEFEFTEEITDDYVKEAYFTLDGGDTYKQIIVNNQCDIPSEVLEKKGSMELGVVAYLVESGTEIKRYNPSPAYFDTWIGSLKDAKNSEPITPTDKEQIEQMLAYIHLSVNKEGKITTISFTNTDGTTQTEQVLDGKSIEYNWSGTQLGIRQEGESNYQYVDLQGPKGDAGAIKMIIVNELPQTGSDDTIYLVPLENPDISGNNYAEYVWINNAWELLGKIGVQVDLTDYYTKQETNTLLNAKADVSDIPTKTSDLTNDSGFITAQANNLANYYTKTEIDNTIGNINSALDTINGEVI